MNVPVWANAPIVVVGDLMLDTYLIGTIERISPEAPVPILRHALDREAPGGAANVAANICALGGSCRLLGVVGNDAAAERLVAMIRMAGADCRAVVSHDRPTITKTRVLAGTHQLVRIDREPSSPLSAETEDAIIRTASDILSGARMLVLSDYNKGCLSDRVLTSLFELARQHCVPVLVDPKRRDFSRYRGATYIKPNLAELSAATGISVDTIEGARAAAANVITSIDATVLLTRSEQGIAYFGRNGEEIVLPTQAREVYDVAGAGDTVAATFALAIAAKASPRHSILLANLAAGIVVSKAGTATASLGELREALRAIESRSEPPRTSHTDWMTARHIREAWRQEGLTVGYTNGCFDLLHPGHIAVLRAAARHCDRLIVGLNGDASVSRLKGPSRPVQSEEARAEIMSAIGCVDLVVLFDDDTPLQLIELLQPDVLVKGADYPEDQIVGADIVRSAGGRVERVELREGQSTTRLIQRTGAKHQESARIGDGDEKAAVTSSSSASS